MLDRLEVLKNLDNQFIIEEMFLDKTKPYNFWVTTIQCLITAI